MFILLSAAGQALPAADGWADRVRLAQRTRPEPRLILVRPDGYIAWATDERAAETREDELRAALTQWCGSATAYSGHASGRSAG
jgi:hypothetical protein